MGGGAPQESDLKKKKSGKWGRKWRERWPKGKRDRAGTNHVDMGPTTLGLTVSLP